MSDMLLWLKTIFGSCWGFFSEINFPILNISFAEFFVGAFLIGFSIKLLGLILGVHVGSVGFLGSSRKNDDS